ncbi:S8 family serine peptidase, partial [Lentzea sp.]|uniref:S8 family serine peptidase n=1 Tax=Lentzea sp. TaxID=56099 RepID=UPI002ED15308
MMTCTAAFRRATAVATAGVLLLTGALPQASAQPSSSPAPPSSPARPPSSAPPTSVSVSVSSPAAPRPNSVPPDLPPGTPPPKDTGEPDVPYEPTNKGCVESDTKSELIEYKPWGQVQLNLEQAHRFATGRGVKIAIIDTGVDPRNPRFGNRVVPTGEYVKGNKNGTDDCDGHGTEVAGVAAAAKTEGDFVGAAPEATILAIRQTSDRF